MNGFRLYLRYAAASVRGQMNYPGAFLLMSAAAFFATSIDFLGVAILYRRFGGLAGWSLGGLGVLYGVVHMAFALADAVTRGFEVLGPEYIKTGGFDRLLLRPRALSLQVMGHELRITRIGRFGQGFMAFAIGVWLTAGQWDAAGALLILWAVAGGMALFSGMLVLQATAAFWTVENIEAANVFTYGGVHAGQFPIDVYAAWLKTVLVFIVPIACVAYFPVATALGRPTGAPAWLGWASPAAGFLFLALSLQLWRLGVSRYASTGS